MLGVAGVTPPYIMPDRYLLPWRVLVFVPFWFENRYYTVPILIWNQVWFSRKHTLYESIYHFNFKWKERHRNRQVQNAFQGILCLHSILSNYDIIFVQRPGQKTGVRNDIFWSERGSGEPCSSPPPRIPRSSPLPPGLKPYQVLKTSCCFCFSTHVKNKCH